MQGKLIFNYEQSNWQKPYTSNKLKQTINLFPVQQIQVMIVSGEETRGILNITTRFKLIQSSFRFTRYNNSSMLERAWTQVTHEMGIVHAAINTGQAAVSDQPYWQSTYWIILGVN